MVLVINIGVILMFLVLGAVFSKGKGAFLISGYNTMSEKEKSKYDEKALCKCMAKMSYSLAGCWLVLSIGIFADITWLFGIGFALFLAVTFIFIIYMNTGKRFQCKEDESQGGKK